MKRIPTFISCWYYRGESMPEITAMMEKKQLKYTSHEIQNELLNIMAQQVLRKVVRHFQSTFYTIMIDETTDSSNSEQLVIVIRWVNDDLSIHEEFIGLYKTDSIKAKSLVAIIKDTLLRLT